ncbi:hypothetical protein [Streptomyces sp. Root1310]|uniref:hypothetical protein n=1 Tax=Streptomyces sp. Root1310 TaxID=1736452 RepID=UPI00070A876D|nr:hypothetical protein [Streptomyces sp. Root1310]KQX70131.1 hypothetical protein ASD48_40340 [Streptomyces sp. Root1310]
MSALQHSGPQRLVGAVWSDNAEAALYEQAVDALLQEPDISRRLGKRPAATAETLRAALLGESIANRAIDATGQSFTKYRSLLLKLRNAQEQQRSRGSTLQWGWRSAGPLVLAVLIALGRFAGAAPLGTLALVMLAAVWLVAGLLYPVSRRTLSTFALMTSALPARLLLTLRVRIRGKEWETELRLGVRPLVPLVLEALLGDDPEELLMADSYDGLRETTGARYVVASATAKKLDRKIAQMAGGTIAVCGPRGAGKTTLLTRCGKSEDFTVRAAAPANFTPHDFLVSLFVDLCEAYIWRAGGEIPNLTRLTTVRKTFDSLGRYLRKRISWLTHAALACGLIAFGSVATVRTLRSRYGKGLYEQTHSLQDGLGSLVLAIWRGDNLAAGLVLIVGGLLVWRRRRTAALKTLLGRARIVLTVTGTLILCFVPLAGMWSDEELTRQVDELFANGHFMWVMATLGLIRLMTPTDASGSWVKGPITVSKPFTFATFRTLALVGMLTVAYRSSELRAILSDPDSSIRVVSVLAGFLVLKIGFGTRKPSEHGLMAECRAQLYRLQTVQTTAATGTSGLSQVVSLGSSHTSSLSTVAPNFPLLVNDFREILGAIALDNHLAGHRTFICIDELDRLGSDAQALAFLREIKAIFGVRHVHYIVSVAEDVGSAFVRRGLPHRDVTDSSLDDVVYVQAATMPLSEEILQKRAPGISPPYVALAHALSGGLPRDLVRYGRRIMETEETTGSAELTDIARRLVLEELSETLSGFRVLLSKQQWDEDTSVILDSFRDLMARLQFEPVSVLDIRAALEGFSRMQHLSPAAGHANQLPEETAHLVAEASAYAYFSLTLLDIFGSEGFTRRSEMAANRGPEGTPQLLAEARQELAVSPHTARRLLRSIRQAWGLDHTTSPAALLPFPQPAPAP